MISRALTALSLALLATPAMADNAPGMDPERR